MCKECGMDYSIDEALDEVLGRDDATVSSVSAFEEAGGPHQQRWASRSDERRNRVPDNGGWVLGPITIND